MRMAAESCLPASSLLAGAAYSEFKGNPGSPGSVKFSIAYVCSCFPASCGEE